MRIMAFILVGFALTTFAQAGNWPNWRGPGHNGVAEGTGYPIRWSSTENVLWKYDLPGKGASTPAVWNGKIILTSAIDEKNGVLCLDWSGKGRWQMSSGSSLPGKHAKATGCNPSPVTDGEHIYTYFKSGDLLCLDMEGNIVWKKNMHLLSGEDTLWWDLGTSPVLTKEHVVVAVIHSGPSFVVAFDKWTGEVAWKQDRTLDAPREAAQTYSTPVVYDDNGKQTLVVLGADHVTAYAAQDGQELWSVGGLNPSRNEYFRSIASPVVEGGIAVAPYARGNSLTAIRLGGSGDVTKSHVVWSKDALGADVPSPVAQNGKTYICGDKGNVTCVETKTGKVLWSGQTDKSRHAFSSSPVLADGKIYLTREDGTVFVIEQGSAFKVLAANALDNEFVVATPVFVDGRILIRTSERLYCIGK